MFDPRIGIDPFDPPLRRHRCPACDAAGRDGLLGVEALPTGNCSVYCDECDLSHLYGQSGPIEIQPQQGNRAVISVRPNYESANRKPPEKAETVMEDSSQTEVKDQQSEVSRQQPLGAEETVADRLAQLTVLVTGLKTERVKHLKLAGAIEDALVALGVNC